MSKDHRMAKPDITAGREQAFVVLLYMENVYDALFAA